MSNYTDHIESITGQLVDKYGESFEEQIRTGVSQVAQRWVEDDGNTDDLANFCLDNFLADAEQREEVFQRFIANLESLFGHLHHVYRDFNHMLHVDAGPMLNIDQMFANYNVYAHVNDDFYKSRLAHVILLNFPMTDLVEKSRAGGNWSRQRWAEARLAEQFDDRIPGEVQRQRSNAYSAVEEYVYNYNIFMDNVLGEDGRSLFDNGLKLISHWGLRDELKAQYALEDGLPRQQLIEKIMERIIRQEIPAAVINSDDHLWNPYDNSLSNKDGQALENSAPEDLERYKALWKTFKAEKQVDPYTHRTPSLIARRFEADREILEDEVENILISVLSAPVLKKIAAKIEAALGRPLAPFDIWYSGFKVGGSYDEATLDEIVSSRYPNVWAFEASIDKILMSLGFSEAKARYLQEHIKVDPARGAGHALGAQMKFDSAHLRTRVPEGGMNYKGFNTAMHELGHTVEQVISMNDIDFYPLQGVPNTAFTEAFAFLFQGKDMEVLGLANEADDAHADAVIHDMWQTLEIAGVSLLDMRIWRWMYANPDAGPAALKDAVIDLATDIWNEFYAPIMGVKDSPILAIYSHIIFCGMYIPDYALGHIISFQIGAYLRDKDLATEMERMCKLGRIAPQVWLQQAIGSNISAQPMIEAAEKAL